jgi:hypothetical protein
VAPDITEANTRLTRKHSAAFLTIKGYPIKDSTFVKLCIAGAGPTPAYMFGGQYLYTDDELLRLAVARCKPVSNAA